MTGDIQFMDVGYRFSPRKRRGLWTPGGPAHYTGPKEFALGLLRDYLPRHTYAVVAGYRDDRIQAAVAAAQIGEDDDLVLQFSGTHGFQAGDQITVHLDNRTQVRQYTDQLPVHRTSYKGEVASADDGFLQVRPRQFQVFHSFRCLDEYRAPGYEFPADPRPVRALAPSPLTEIPGLKADEAGAHLGVMVTRAVDRPHTTVMAFLSSEAGDIFLITDSTSFKGRNLARDPRALFAVDFRATYDLAKPLDWAYRLQPVRTHLIPPTTPLFQSIRNQFLAKNPWEGAFFLAPTSVLLHLVTQP